VGGVKELLTYRKENGGWGVLTTVLNIVRHVPPSKPVRSYQRV
jgi:hypothetical protein